MKPIPRGGTEKYMEQEIQVSVILLTYEPKWEKLERTARSILRQTGIETEIVVGDDGSKNDLFPRLEALLRSGGARYTLHKCPRNVGTLRNALEALYRAALSDKKISGGKMHLIVPEAIGRCRIESIPEAEIRDWMRDGGIQCRPSRPPDPARAG